MAVDVQTWLKTLGLETYGPAFAENDIDEEALRCLTAEDLKELGVVSLGHRKRLLAAVAALGATPAVPGVRDRRVLDPSRDIDLGGAERKIVTVLFADLVDSTSLVQSLDPEAAAALLEPAVDAVAAAVEQNAGTIVRKLGDGLMAVFGAPSAREDHAVCACDAAIEAQAAVRRLAGAQPASRGRPLHFRIGLNSGEVMLRLIAHDSIEMMGATVHIASRMEASAEPGTIRITRDTLRLAEGAVNVLPLGALTVKGLGRPVEVFELLSKSALRRTWTRAARSKLVRYVGRSRELATLDAAAATALAGSGRIVAVSGGAGLGKSRLFVEFLGSEAAARFRGLRGTAVSHGAQHPYQPMVDLMQEYFGLGTVNDSEAAAKRVRERVLSASPSLDTAVPALQALLDLPVDDPRWARLEAPEQRRATIDAVTGLIVAESSAQPIAIVFEDLHWVDEGTLAILNAVVDALPDHGILLLVNYRPEFADPWGARGWHVHLPLHPLGTESASRIIDDILGTDLSLLPLRDVLAERTGGNPLFLEETALSLIESGAVEKTVGSGFRLARPLADMEIPPSIQSIIAARVDSRSAQEKLVLRSAAVIGMEVPLRLLADLLRRGAEDLRPTLSALQAAEFLYEVQLVPEPEYRFKHALTQDVAYRGLLREERRQMHGRIVAAIEALPESQRVRYVETLAGHAFRGELWEKALHYHRRAWERAQARSLYREAAGFLRVALEALERLPESLERTRTAVDIRFDLRASLFPLAEFDVLDSLLEEALALSRKIADRDRQIASLGYLASARWRANRAGEGLTLAREALGLHYDGMPDLQAVTTYWTLGVNNMSLGRFAEAAEWLSRLAERVPAEGIADKPFDVSRHGALARSYLGLLAAEVGDLPRARLLADEACRLADLLGQFFAVSHNQHVAALIDLHSGAPRNAVARLEPILERTALDAPVLIARVESTLGCALVQAGQVERGLALAEHANEAETRRRGAPTALPAFNLAWAYLSAGELDRAAAAAARALSEARSGGEASNENWTHLLAAEIATRRGQGRDARFHYEAAAVGAARCGHIAVLVRCPAELRTDASARRG
jgi:class 3 adenylate cyclase/tetratricopeptide (TPR) repeat protein